MAPGANHYHLEPKDYPNRSIEYTPYFMAYGAKAVCPTSLEYGAPWLKVYADEENDSSLQDTLDQLDEAHDIALLLLARYQQALFKYHNRRIRGRILVVGDLVL
jgi:hypothetical protein